MKNYKDFYNNNLMIRIIEKLIIYESNSSKLIKKTSSSTYGNKVSYFMAGKSLTYKIMASNVVYS